MWKICVRIGMCYLCTIHIIDAYSSTTKKNASPSMYIGGLYIGGLGEGRSSEKKWLLFLGHLSPKVYTHYVCFSSFLFPGDLPDSLDILWQPLATCHQGEAMYIGGLGEGRCPPPKKVFLLSLATSPPKVSHIYIYIYTHTMFFSSFLFPGNLHDSLDILWQPLRMSDILCGSLAIPSQVYDHDRTWCSKNTAFPERCKNGDLTTSFSVFLHVYIYISLFVYIFIYRLMHIYIYI